jgi:hypothetical protein
VSRVVSRRVKRFSANPGENVATTELMGASADDWTLAPNGLASTVPQSQSVGWHLPKTSTPSFSLSFRTKIRVIPLDYLAL